LQCSDLTNDGLVCRVDGDEPLPAGGVAELSVDKQLMRKAEATDRSKLYEKEQFEGTVA
jgi:hypothetical protein